MAQQNGTGWQPITGSVLPNNPVNKLNAINQGINNINSTPMNNANINTSAPMSIRPDLINNTQTPVQQGALQPITNTPSETSTNSRFVGFQNPTNNNLNKWESPIMWQSTPKRDNTVTTNTKKKEKWNVPTLREQVNTHNNNVTQTLRDFQKAVHDTNGSLTAEMIQQAFPEYDVNDALNLQQELIPIVVGKGTYANIEDIEKYYPNLIKRYNFEELNNEYQQTSKSNKRAIDAVNNLSESDYNKLSPDGKKYYEIVLKMDAAVKGIKDKYDIPKETSDAEILNRAINFDPDLKSEVAQLQTLNLTGLDKAYLKLDTNWINKIAKFTNDAVNWVNDKYQQNISQPLEELATTQAPHLGGVSGLANAIGILPQTLAEVSNAFMHINKPYESPSGDSDISEIAPQVFSDIVEVSFPLIFEFIAAKYPSATMLFESPLGQPTSTVEGENHNFGKTIGDWFERAKNNITGPILEATVMNTPYWDNMTEEAQEYIKNAIPLLFAHFISKGGEKVLKSDSFQAGLKVTGDLIKRAAKEGRDSARFQKYVEDGLNRIEGGEVYDESGNKIGRTIEQGDLSREQRWRIIKEGYKGAKDSVQDSMQNIGKDFETAKNEVKTFKDLQEQISKTKSEVNDLKDEIVDDNLKGTKEKSAGIIKEKDTELKEIDEDLKNIDKDKTIIEKGANEIAGITDDIKDNPFFSSDSTKMIEAVKEDGGLDIAEYQTRQYEQILDFIADKINDAINTKNKEVGPLYDVAVQQNVPVILEDIVKGALDIIRNNDGISYNNGVLEFLDDRFSGKEQKALQGIIDRLSNPDTDWNTSTLWDVRKYADLNAKWGTSATTDGVAIIRDLRKVIDDGLRDQVPGFKDIDTEYVNAIDTLDELSGKLTLKKAKPGTLRENAVSTVKNLLNPSNRLYLNRLEKLIPGITQKLQSIKNLRQVYNAYVKGNTSGFTAGIENAIGNKITSTVGGLIGASGGIPGAMLGYLIGRGLEKSIKGIKKTAVEKVVKTITPKARLELKKIAARIEEGKKLTEDQKKRLEEIKNKIIVEGDKVKKTREQERAWKEEKARIERERNNFIDKVEEGKIDNALPNKKNTGDGGKNIITGNDKTIITDKKGQGQRKVGPVETNKEGELYDTKGTRVIDKIETPQKTAQNIIQDAENVEKGKQLPTNPETKNGKPVVIDSKGNAKEFYHGTPNGGFTEFDIDKRGTSNDFSSFGDYGRGIYFTPYKEDAENYATKNTKVEGKTPTVYKVKLYMSNPLRLDILANIQKDSYNIEGNPVQNANWNNEFKKILDKYGYTEEQYEKDYSMGDSLYDNWGDWDIRAQGYDGVVSPDGREWIVTDVNQIQTLEYESKKPSKTAITGGKVSGNKKEEKKEQQKKTAITEPKKEKKVRTPKKTNVEKFREETAKYYPDYKGIESRAKDLAQEILDDAGVDAEIVDAVLTGSKSRGLDYSDSDNDILIEIKPTGKERLREDSLFDLLNDEELNDGAYDFNPILADDSGTLEDVVLEHEQYLKEKKILKDLLDKEGVKRDKDTSDAVGVLRGTDKQLLQEFLEKTDGPINFFGEKKTKMASAHMIGTNVNFTIGAEGNWSPAMKDLLDKLNEVRKSKTPSKTIITDNKKRTDEVDNAKGKEPTESVPGNSVYITDDIARQIKVELDKLLKEVREIWKKGENYSPMEFLQKIKESIPVKNPQSNSIYLYVDIDEKTHTLRISKHSSHAFLAKQYGYEDNNTSLVIRIAKNSEFKDFPDVYVNEYIYIPEKLTKEKMEGIIKGIKNWVDTGIYNDTNYDIYNKSPDNEKVDKNKQPNKRLITNGEKLVDGEAQELVKYNGLLTFYDGKAYSDNVFGHYDYTYETNQIKSQGVLIAKMNTQMQVSIEVGDKILEQQLENAIMGGELSLDINGNVINHSNYDGVEIYDSVSGTDDNGKPTQGSRIITFMKLAKHSDEREFGGRMLLSRFLKEYGEKIQKAQPEQSIDNSQKNVITSSSNTPLTSNNIKDGGNKENSRGNNEGHKELSDTKQNVQQNDKITKATTDNGDLSRITKTQYNSGDNLSEHRTGSTNGRSKSTIWEKGDNIIKDKTVTQARDINRESVSILEKHDYSTNPSDYTKEEIDTLRQYEGRGGVNDKADSKTQGALNQYYTKDNIIKAMWRLVDKYRPKEGDLKIVEPSMGVGRFFLYAPEGSDLYGFEYDKIPGTIAKILFPNANITIGDFQDNFMVGKFSMGDNYTGRKYDVVIGNPPYEERQGRQRGLGEEPKITRFDDYFIKRGIDMLEDGGILLFVTSSQFLRGADNYAKQKISENAQLIDAYRIPIGAFDRTQVETDIVVFKKTKDGGDKKLLSASEWFIQNPDKILGEERNDIQGRFGPKTGVVGDLSAIDEIAAVKVGTDGLPAKIEKTFTPTKETTHEQKTEKTAPKKKTRAKKTVDPTQWQDWTEIRVNDKGEQETVVWGKSLNGLVFKGKGGPTGTMKVGKGGIGKYQKLLNANGKIGDSDIKLEDDREGLNYINGELEPNILYASGHIPSKLQQLEVDYEGGFIDDAQYNKQKNLLEQAIPEPKAYQDIYFSPYADRVLDTETETIASEYVYKEGLVDKKQTIRKLFRKRIQDRVKSFGNVIHIKKTQDGLQYETQSVGEGMIGLLDKNTRNVSQEQKNAIVTKMPKAFNEFMKSNEIDESTKVRLQDQFNKTYNSYANFEYDELGYTVEDISNTFMGKEFNTSDVQTRGIARILTTEAMIIAHGVGQGKTIEGIIGAIASMQQGKAKRAIIVIPAGTKASRMQTVASLFPNQEMVDLGSLAGTSGIRKRLAETYGPDPRDWIQDGQLVFLEHSAVGNQISFKPDTLSLLEQSLTDAMESSFDNEKVIAEKQKKLTALQDKQESGKLSASQIEKNNKQIENLLGDIEKLGRTTAELSTILKKYVGKGLDEAGVQKAIELIDDDYDYYKSEMEKYIDSSESIEDKANAKELADSIFINERAIYLEDLGIDHITVDEAHNFRNLFKKSLQEDDEGNASFHAGLNAGEGSKAAKNLYAMTQYIMSINGGGNVILLTATPFINNPSEVYNMLSYVGKNGMAEMGVTSMDDFYDNYVGLENKLTPTASASGVGYKNVMVQFNNTDTLIKNLLDRYIDYEGESSAIVKPRLNTVVARLKMGDEQQEIENLLEEQIDTNNYIDTYHGKDLGIERKTNDKGEEQGAVIEGMTQANLNLISPYLTKYKKSELPTLTVDEMLRTSPKLQAVVEIAKRQRESGIMRGTFIYMPDGKVLHELLKKALEEAMPGVKVGIINGDSKYKDLTETQAKKLGLGTGKGAKARLTGKQFHDGEIDILIGGDNTKEGLNLQGNGYMTIEVSQPRNANDRIQLLGRIWRQGNLSNEVIDVLLLMENSSDIYRFELMSRKNSRWSLLEMLSSYKKGEKLEDVKPQGELDMNEEKMALFTDPEKKAKVSIAMDSAKLKDDVAQLEGQIDSVKKMVENISNWGGQYGTYKDIPENGYKNYLSDKKDSEGKVVATNIFDENALEPLEEQLQYHYDEAYRDLSKENERYERGWNKADIEKRIRKQDPYYYSSSAYNSVREKLSIARGIRNSVLRQSQVLGINTLEGLTKYLEELNQQKEKTEETIKGLESTLQERTAEFKKIQEANKENEMSLESILEDITEEFKHQITLGSKDELKNWIELTKDLPKREQANNKTAITEGKNRYIWQSKDYVGKQATFNKPKNLITSQFTEYTEDNPKPEIKYIGYVPKEVVKKVDGKQLTKIGYQSQFRQLASKIGDIEYRAKRNAEDNWRLDEQELLDNDTYYQSLKKRIGNMILKFTKNFEEEIIKAFKKDNPGKTYATAEDFYDYLNDYAKFADGKVSKIEDKYVKESAEYLANKFNGNNGNSKNSITLNENNKITDY